MHAKTRDKPGCISSGNPSPNRLRLSLIRWHLDSSLQSGLSEVNGTCHGPEVELETVLRFARRVPKPELGPIPRVLVVGVQHT